MADFYEFNSLADSETFLVAYPQGFVREKESPEWDPGNDGSENMQSMITILQNNSLLTSKKNITSI